MKKTIVFVLALLFVFSLASAKELPRMVGHLILQAESESINPIPFEVNGEKYKGGIIYGVIIANPTDRDYKITIHCDFYDNHDHLISSSKIENGSDGGPIIVKAGMVMGGKALFAFKRNVLQDSKYHEFRIEVKPVGVAL